MNPSRGGQKSWVGPFQCVVRNGQERQSRSGGRSFFTAELEDPHNSQVFIRATADANFTRLEGALVEVFGPGISREEYNGQSELKIGRNATVQQIGNITAAQRTARAPQRGYAPARSADSQRGPARPTSAPAVPRPDTRPEDREYGPAVGNALQIASNAILHAGLAAPGTSAFAKHLWEIASDVLRVNKFMAAGKLAPKATPEEPADPRERQAQDARDAKEYPADYLPGDPPDSPQQDEPSEPFGGIESERVPF